ENPGFRAGTAALQTVNVLNNYLASLQWQLYQAPEGFQALGRAKEVIEEMSRYANSAQGQNHGIRRILESLEPVGDTLDHVTEQLAGLSASVLNMEQSMGQLAQMVVQIGAAVMALAHVANHAGVNQLIQELIHESEGPTTATTMDPLTTTAADISWEILSDISEINEV
ncbi:unnamed protein product, partial [Prorocentrum cordatum]